MEQAKISVEGALRWDEPVPDMGTARPLDRVQRNFHAERPNRLWVVDFTWASTWQGRACVALVTDALAGASSAGRPAPA